MAALLNTGLLLGLVLAVGAGVFARFIAPGTLAEAIAPGLRAGLWLGASLLAVTSLLDVASTLQQIFGALDAGLYLDYLRGSRQGLTVLTRLGLLIVLLAFGLGLGRRRTIERALYLVVAVLLLASVSRVSHSGVLGLLPLLGDLGHVSAAAAWGGTLLYAAALPVWNGPGSTLQTLLARLSSVGLVGVLLLVASGIYASTLLLFGFGAFTQTAYGATLALKLALVAVIVAIAATNRWSLLPAVRRVAEPDRQAVVALRRTVRIEALMLIAVFAVTGLLGTREPASDAAHLDHGLAGLAGLHGEHAQALAELQTGPIVVGLTSDPDTALALLVVRLQDGDEPVVGATVRLLEGDAAQDVVRPLPPVIDLPGLYGTSDFGAPEFGEWRVTVGIEYPDGRRVVEELPVIPFGPATSEP